MSRKGAEEYEKALKAVEKLGQIENDEAVSKLCILLPLATFQEENL